MELAEARALVQDKTDKIITVRHLISVEGVMRTLGRRLGRMRTAGRWPACSTTWTRIRPGRTCRGMPIWPRSGCGRPGSRSRWSTRCWPTPTSSTAPT
jgi:hypothetical protein